MKCGVTLPCVRFVCEHGLQFSLRRRGSQYVADFILARRNSLTCVIGSAISPYTWRLPWLFSLEVMGVQGLEASLFCCEREGGETDSP
jgi:hypothetical protein